MPLQLDDLGGLDVPTPGEGRPMPLALDGIDEDPAQPRHEFDANGLLELAATIRDRGVRQPRHADAQLREQRRPVRRAPGDWVGCEQDGGTLPARGAVEW